MSSTPNARTPRRPLDWLPPGPAPARHAVPLQAEEVLSYLLGDWQIIQRRDGHRWSLDDLVTAWVASQTPPPPRCLDLGTGIGSVSLMLAWCFPETHVTGVEAQDVSFDMARRSVRFNGVEARFTLVHGDLRRVVGREVEAGTWPLVTGTPPYFDDPAQTRSTAIQKEPCRFELRGGVEDYLEAMARAVSSEGTAVICHASRQRDRVLRAIAANGFHIRGALEVTPKVGREPLVDVFTLAPARGPSCVDFERLTVRDEADQWTEAFTSVRLSMGLPPRVTRLT
jgi:tRNA1(Val) A37 N6-methylase TrmN6